MNRLLSLLLIPFFVLGQALPHSHAGTGVHESDDHAARPHWHLSTEHSQHHAHDDDHDHQEHVASVNPAGVVQSVVSSLPVEHDSDAIYLAQSTSSLGRASVIGQSSFTSLVAFVEVLGDRPVLSRAHFCKQVSDRFAGLPIYLLVSSLRL